MFPQPVQDGIESTTSKTVWALGSTFSLASKAMWVVSTSALVLVIPLLYEIESDAAMMQENLALQNQQKQSELVSVTTRVRQLMLHTAHAGSWRYACWRSASPSTVDTVTKQCVHVHDHSLVEPLVTLCHMCYRDLSS